MASTITRLPANIRHHRMLAVLMLTAAVFIATASTAASSSPEGEAGLANGQVQGQAGAAEFPPSVYDPRTDPGSPAFDPSYNPHLDPSSPLYDENYDPRTDPHHPLKQGDRDPGEAWERARRSDGTPSNFGAITNWPWRELFFDSAHPTGVKVHNRCESTQTISIFVYDLPYLEGLPAKVRVPGNRTIEVPVTIRTPPEPDPPLPLGPPPHPPFGWVAPPFVPRGTNVGFHQPNFTDVKGRVVLWHPWAGKCKPRRETYNVTGHIHFRPPAEDDPDPQPQRANRAAPCWLWWSTGRRPPDIDGDATACREEIRGFAIAWREGEIAGQAELSAEAWSWLPAIEQIPEMSAGDLVAMKVRAEEQLARRPGVRKGER